MINEGQNNLGQELTTRVVKDATMPNIRSPFIKPINSLLHKNA